MFASTGTPGSRSGLKLLGLLASAVVAPIAAAAGPVEPVGLAPHRAVYDFELSKSGANSVTEMRGRMVYELTGSTCEGFTQTMRFVTRGVNQDGAANQSDTRSTTWEDADGKQFRFDTSQIHDKDAAEKVHGAARRGSPGIDVSITQPESKSLHLDPTTLFPVQHALALLDAARHGKTSMTADLYDGSDSGDKVFSTTAVIGAPFPAGHNKSLPKVPNTEVLDGLRAWPVSLSYFDKGKAGEDATPAYQLGFIYYEDGVSRRLVLDYGDFALKGDLRSITFLDRSTCEAGKK